ncbi:NAD-dependent epimerase/dehydratase family protein [Mycolicibacterium baixiangningiae]|uniref:NAD-dependent epimerase/dehydratase family protein n=1 Tax=Mycolicibacterium baixiangningiae TaxID=2761578 RepID=UPI001867C48E|nr:NAD(P)-dependent oxidoreductase [Mycolicibacterium baixiangningiae]
MVTGATGFLGRHLVDSLRTAGVDVVGAAHTVGDFFDVTDPHQVHQVFARFKPEGVVHLGAISGPMVSRDRPWSIVDVNIGGTANLLEAARINGTRRFLLASSNAVYGSNPGPLDEQVTVLKPSSVYGATKVAGEHLVAAYGRRYGLSTCSLRISAVYGPGRSTHCIIALFIRDALAGRVSRVAFGADFSRQYVYVDDAVRSIVCVLTAGPEVDGQSVNISGTELLQVGEIADIVTEMLPEVRIEFGQGPDPDDDDVQGPFVLTRARELLGFESEVSMRDGIARYANHLQRAHDG